MPFKLLFIGDAENMPPRVITITNQKGGTGKTTLTALLGYGLASRGYNVLLIDLDPQAHLSSLFLKIDEIENVDDGAIQMAQGLRFKMRNINLGTRGEIRLIPSGLNYIVQVFRGQIPSWDPMAIYTRISTEPAIKGFDFVLCDTPPELFPPTIWGLYAADFVIIPSNLEELSIAGVKLLLSAVLPEVIYRSKKELRILGVVFTNIVRKVGQGTIDGIGNGLLRFIRRLPPVVAERFYEKPIFNAHMYRYDELRDLVYRPRRWELPLRRVIERNNELSGSVAQLTLEVINRIQNFKGLGP